MEGKSYAVCRGVGWANRFQRHLIWREKENGNPVVPLSS